MSTQTTERPTVEVPRTTGRILWRMISDRRRSITGWSIGTVLLMALMAGAYPSIRETGDAMDEYVQSLPEGMQEAFGLAGDSIASPPGYLTSQLYANMYPIVLLILGLGMAAWSIAGTEADGTLEMTLGNPVSRTRVAVERFVGMALIVAFVTTVSTAALALLSPPTGLDEGLAWWGIWSAGLQSFAFVMVICGLAFAVGAATGSRGLAITVGSAVAVIGFLIQALAPIADFMESLRVASPWYWLLRDNPVTTGLNDLNFWLPMGLSAVFVGLGVLALSRRDLKF
jgi:ABC-2 type transport system permease protein